MMSNRPIRSAKESQGAKASKSLLSGPQSIVGISPFGNVFIAPYVKAALGNLVKHGIFTRGSGVPAPSKAILKAGIAEIAQTFFMVQQYERLVASWDDLKLFENIAIRTRDLELALGMQSSLKGESDHELASRSLNALHIDLEQRGTSLSEIRNSLKLLAGSCDSLAETFIYRRSKKLLRADVYLTAPLFAKLWQRLSGQTFKRDYRFFPSNNSGLFKSPGALFVQLCLISLDDRITPRNIKTALEYADKESPRGSVYPSESFWDGLTLDID